MSDALDTEENVYNKTKHSTSSNYLNGGYYNLTYEEENMSDKTKKVVKATSMCVTVLGIAGLVVSGATDAEISLAVKVGTGIAAIIGSIITAILPKQK